MLLLLLGKWYIYHTDESFYRREEAYYGPFSRSEITKRLNDEYSHYLLQYGHVIPVKLNWWQTRRLHIFSASAWMYELKKLENG